MIDTHAHLNFSQFDQDREEVIVRFFSQGGKAIINVGVDLERSRKSIEIAEKHNGIYASVGIHPEYFSRLPENFSKVRPFPSSSRALGIPQDQTLKNSSSSGLFREFKELAKNKKVVAIGECGLDYYRIKKLDFSRGNPILVEEIKENQRRGFLAQIGIARELDLPVIVHCREAWDDLYEIVSCFSKSSAFPLRKRSSRNSSKLSFDKFVLHCYSGEKKDTEKFLELPNVYFSFSGNITYPKPVERAKKLAEAIKMIPLDKIMLDSDAPFLAPQEKRGKRNEPIFVKYIARKLAEVKNVSEEKVERATDENAMKFFDFA